MALYFRNQLRAARSAVLRDGEAYIQVVFVLERLGRVLQAKREVGLAKYKYALRRTAEKSPFAVTLPEQFRQYHREFSTLFELLLEGRNSALHEGAVARHLAANSVELSLILEDALMAGARTVGDYMVRTPTVALEWQPLSFIRQLMLSNSFSYLPVMIEGEGWRLVSDVQVAKYVRSGTSKAERERRLSMCLEATVRREIHLEMPVCVRPEILVEDVLSGLSGLPLLVFGDKDEELIGIVTAFDLL